MDWKSFVASMTSSLAWPLALVTTLFLFRTHVRNLIAQVRKFGAGGVNIEIADRVEEVRTASERVEEEQQGAEKANIVLDPETLSLANLHPEAAVLESFKEIEGILLQIRSNLPDDRPHRTLNEVLRYLNDKQYISGSVITLFQRLREARNTVAHAKEEKMTTGEALELIRQNKQLARLLLRVGDQLPPKQKGI